MISPVVELSTLPLEQLREMGRAADELVALLEDMRARGTHPVSNLWAAGTGTFITFAPYPDNGVGRANDKYAWYYHAHDPCQDRPWLENGHFHCFAFVDDIAADVTPWATPTQARPDNRQVAHLIALCVNQDGIPDRMFTLNRWASDETLYPAEIVAPLVAGFEIAEDDRFRFTSRWLSLLLRLLQPQITSLLLQRDQVLRAAETSNPAGFAEDPVIEVTSTLAFSLDNHLSELELALEVRADSGAS
jgi:hypothetical protein